MALFTKEPDKNSRTDQNQNPKIQPQPSASSVTPTVVTTNPLPSEKAVPLSRAPVPAPGSESRAYLDAGSKISGKLSFDGPTRIDGQVDGEITGKDSLTVGESAVVTAQIRAAAIIVAGKVSGDIIATQRIEIRPSAKVIGNLTAPVLVVHEGALFEGHCSMQPEASQGAKVTVFAKDERVAAVGVQKQA
jgi:cytoskeletal protein CcmA (bactofilin family)